MHVFVIILCKPVTYVCLFRLSCVLSMWRYFVRGETFFMLFLTIATVGKWLFSHSCFVCVFRERRPTFMWRRTALAAPAMVAPTLWAAVEVVTLCGIPARTLALRHHLTLIKPPASSSGLEKINVASQVLYSFHRLFAVLIVCSFSCFVFLFLLFPVFSFDLLKIPACLTR